MAKIAVDVGAKPAQNGSSKGALHSRVLAEGEGWSVEEIICTAGPHDRPFEEQHSQVAIAMVLSGTFQYRTASRTRGSGELMSPGSVMLGNAGQLFECGHEHAAGDRCLSFRYAPEHFERIAADAGAAKSERTFRVPRLPAVRELSPVVSGAAARMTRNASNDNAALLSWEELSVVLAAQTIALACGIPADRTSPAPSTVARITRAVRVIERDLAAPLSLRALGQHARLSPYHFLRSFEQVTGLTPHQFVRRARLRAAAARLKSEPARVLDIALDYGFLDASNFNRAFRSEFGISPLQFRRNRAAVG